MRNRQDQATPENAFKFKELKVYNSTEYLWDNVKKYRQVFDRYETAYIYTELSLYNKFYDEQDWSLKVDLKCYIVEEEGRTEICNLTIDKEVSKFDQLIFLREGWGNKRAGTFWKKGTYYWDAYVDGQKIGTKYFYVIEPQNLALDEEELDWLNVESTQKYLKIKTVRLYEGPYDDVLEADRVYLKEFSVKETRYIYVELTLENLQPYEDWHLELFTRFQNEARELKGQIVRLQQIKKGQDRGRHYHRLGRGEPTPLVVGQLHGQRSFPGPSPRQHSVRGGRVRGRTRLPGRDGTGPGATTNTRPGRGRPRKL